MTEKPFLLARYCHVCGNRHVLSESCSRAALRRTGWLLIQWAPLIVIAALALWLVIPEPPRPWAR